MVRRRPGEAYKPQCLTSTVTFGGESVMNWGCFIKAGIRHICLCEWCMNQAIYQVVMEENLLPSALTLFPNSEDCFFQQDNASCHTAMAIKVWMEDQDQDTFSMKFQWVRDTVAWLRQTLGERHCGLASLFSSPEPHSKPLECNQKQDRWSQAIKLLSC